MRSPVERAAFVPVDVNKTSNRGIRRATIQRMLGKAFDFDRPTIDCLDPGRRRLDLRRLGTHGG